ncbi:MAG TPA: hypothetical protein VJ001_16875 [Rhodocyclaceae bacterium]|nr:hypothetical protein [Rhodocyclaceae bacterium]
MLKTLKILLPCALLAIVPATALAQVVKELVGKFQMDVQDGDVLELRADGTANLAGEETTWSARNHRLSVGPDTMPYLLQGNRLVLTMGSIQIAWKRLGGADKGLSPMQKAAVKAAGRQPGTNDAAVPMQPGVARTPPGGNAQDIQAKQILMSSAWCSFTYNQRSGTSTTRKVVFRPDGVMTIGGGGETYSSGYGGVYAGQSSSADAMRWKFENLRLYIDSGDGGGFQDVGLSATKNSNGAPILHADGREYSMCN